MHTFASNARLGNRVTVLSAVRVRVTVPLLQYMTGIEIINKKVKYINIMLKNIDYF
jgi:hypothetical protein